MANYYVPNSDLSFIIGDGGISSASPAPTKVNNDKVNACLELQSTTRADIFFKPKTDAQINSIPNPAPGMTAFSSDSHALVVRGSSSWGALVPSAPSPILFSSVTLSTSDIQLMASASPVIGVNILPAPGPGLNNIIHSISFNLFDTDAVFGISPYNVRACYDYYDIAWSRFASAEIPNSFFVNGGSNLDRTYYVVGNNGGGLATPFTNTGIVLVTVGPSGFAVTGSPTANVDIWYSIVQY